MLKELFDRHGRVFPVKCGRHPYFIVTVDTEVDALDYERSIFQRLETYDDIQKDLIGIKKVVLKPVIPERLDIFRLKGKPDVAFTIIVADKFKDIYESNGLTGLLFRPTM